jgi:predicted TIM-barrel fold metal-dependent hydrolase
METTTRRAFIRSSALAALLPAQRGSVVGRQGEGEGYLDAHVHVWTPDTTKYPLALSFKPADMEPPSFTPEQLFAHSRPEGVTRIVLIQMSFYRFDNRYMLDVIAERPGVFSGVAIIDENAPDVRGRMRGLREKGVRGFRVYAGTRDLNSWMGSPGMAEMWKVAADEDLSICPLINPEALPAVDKMCGRFPRTSVVIDHFARIGVTGSVERAELDNLLRLSSHRRVYVKTSAFYALGQKKPPYLDLGPMIRELRDTYGAERLMWASDCPFQVGSGHTYHDSIALIGDRLDFLTPEDKAWMLRQTAERVFF